MSILLDLSEERLQEQLPLLLAKWEQEIAKSEKLFDLKGERLEAVARALPQHQAHYAQLAQEAKHLVKWIENDLARIEARLTKNYLQGQRVYGARETTTLIGGEREMIEQKQLIIEASLVYQKLDEIVEAFKQMGWMLGHITKLHVASIQDVVL
jgi:hypothetical protein